MNAQQKADLVAFLKSLTDARVACQSKPFDHPSLLLSTGATGNENAVQPNPQAPSEAKDDTTVIPQVGQNGCLIMGVQNPTYTIKPFDSLLAP